MQLVKVACAASNRIYSMRGFLQINISLFLRITFQNFILFFFCFLRPAIRFFVLYPGRTCCNNYYNLNSMELIPLATSTRLAVPQGYRYQWRHPDRFSSCNGYSLNAGLQTTRRRSCETEAEFQLISHFQCRSTRL